MTNWMLLSLLILQVIDFCRTQASAWPNNWQATFTESAWWLTGNGTLTGTFSYLNDTASNQTYQLIERSDAFTEKLCASIYPFSHTPCSHLVRQGKRYILFPEKKYCCACCTAAQGCGVLKANWMVPAKFTSEYKDGNDTVFMYNIAGLQNNYYGVDQNQIPRRIYQEPISDIWFNATSYFRDTVAPAKFDLPTDSGDCDKQCPLFSYCTLVALA